MCIRDSSNSGNVEINVTASDNILIGKGLAEALNLQLNDKLAILTQDDDKLPFGPIPRLKEFNIVGIF